MQPFITLSGIAAPIAGANVNTDIIAPKALMRAVTRHGLGWGLFGPFRYADDGSERPEFILNQEPFRHAKIIVARENFGCGSSREHAAWALLDFGVRAVIAPSYAEIFFNNCCKNGILPITLPADEVERLLAIAARGESFTVDLAAETIQAGSALVPFTIPSGLKRALLEGRDEVDTTLAWADSIERYERTMFEETPWLERGLAS